MVGRVASWQWFALTGLLALGASCGTSGDDKTQNTDAGSSGAGAGTGGGPGSGGAAGSAAGGKGGGGRGGGGNTGGASGSGGDLGNAGSAGTGQAGQNGGGEGVTCGTDTCDAGLERCVSESIDGMLGVSCVPTDQGFCAQGGGCLVLECDGPEDCDAGQVCFYTQGESEYLRCGEDLGGYGQPCAGETNCPAEYPVCREIASEEQQLLLGWSPAVCLEF